MSIKDDPLLKTFSSDSFAKRSDRLKYATGGMLGADDFQDEQLYHRRQLALTLRLLYGSGTVAGLKVIAAPEGTDTAHPANVNEVQIAVEPGLAIDRAGRVIEVPVQVSIRLKKWLKYITSKEYSGNPHVADCLSEVYDSTLKSVPAEVFLSFHQCERGWTPAFASGPFDALDASQPSRIRDAFEFKLVLGNSGTSAIHDPWKNVSNEPALEDVQDAILGSWVSHSLDKTSGVPFEVNDANALLLARVNIPVISSGAPESIDNDFDWSAATWQEVVSGGNTDIIQNRIRSFIIPPALLRKLNSL